MSTGGAGGAGGAGGGAATDIGEASSTMTGGGGSGGGSGNLEDIATAHAGTLKPLLHQVQLLIVVGLV